ncbi:MAG: hypothetical protein PHC56_02000 [Herbinix sp.]|nr:hypothetical protein [Herbinix sp.]
MIKKLRFNSDCSKYNQAITGGDAVLHLYPIDTEISSCILLDESGTKT